MAKEKWRKLRGIGSLDRRRLASVRALFHGARKPLLAPTGPRKRSCRRFDRRDRPPQSEQERNLETLRGLPRRDLAAIVAAVAQTRELPLKSARPR